MAWVRHAINKEPAMAMAGVLGTVAIAIPYIVVPLRRSMGLPTYQWDANPESHPFINYFGDNYKHHDFDNAELLARWSQHGEYRYSNALTVKDPQDPARDFPEARERLRAKGLLR